jgi:putative membrane protein
MLTSLLTACAFFVSTLAIGWVVLLVHDLLTPGYRTWPEIHRGNLAAGLAAGGQILGIAVIANAAINHTNDHLTIALLWTGGGGALMILGYLLFEFLTPKINVGHELANDNRAVGVVSFAISVGTAIILAACMP